MREFVSIEQGIKNAGYSIITDKLLEEYDCFFEQALETYDNNKRKIAEEGNPQNALLYMMSNPFSEPSYRPLETEELLDFLADLAVYILSRNSDEGADRKLTEGDYYLTKQNEWISNLCQSIIRR